MNVNPPMLVLVRHARTEWNRQGRLNSTVDLPLDADGRRAAQHVAASLGPLEAPIIVSPACRARETAAPLADATGQEVEVDGRLAEVAFGRFEGLTMASLADDPDFARWRAGHEDLGEHEAGEPGSDPSPESLPAAARRLLAFLADAGERFSTHGTVVAVGHGVALRVLLCTGVLGLPPAAYRRLRIDNAHSAVLAPATDETGYRLAACNVPAYAVPDLLSSVR
jgi:broad specificity phosphatase PhoE